MQDICIVLKKLSDEKEEGAGQLESEENEEENKMVTVAVTIDEPQQQTHCQTNGYSHSSHKLLCQQVTSCFLDQKAIQHTP